MKLVLKNVEDCGSYGSVVCENFRYFQKDIDFDSFRESNFCQY